MTPRQLVTILLTLALVGGCKRGPNGSGATLHRAGMAASVSVSGCTSPNRIHHPHGCVPFDFAQDRL